MTGPAFEFTSDWFSGNIYLFDRHVMHLRGTPCRLLEIGSFEGRSAIWLLENVATHPQARIDCVDNAVRPTMQRNIGLVDTHAKITAHKGKSGDLLATLPPEAFDFIYVDGSHYKIDVLEDCVLSFRLAKPGAVIAFDDYLEDSPGWNPHDFAKPAIDAFLDIYASRIEVIDRCHQIWIRKR